MLVGVGFSVVDACTKVIVDEVVEERFDKSVVLERDWDASLEDSVVPEAVLDGGVRDIGVKPVNVSEFTAVNCCPSEFDSSETFEVVVV